MKTPVNLFLKQIFVVIALICVFNLNAQDKETKSSAVYPMFGIGIGFFYPSEINDYINDVLLSGYITTNAEIYMWLEGHAGLGYRYKILEVTGFLEYALAPKITTGAGDESVSYSFNRFSPALMANVHLPIGSGKHSLFAGAGPQYHMMKFKDFEASTLGFRIQAGVSLMFGKFNLQPFGAFNYAKAEDTSNEYGDMEMNYTGGQIGLNLSFHPVIK